RLSPCALPSATLSERLASSTAPLFLPCSPPHPDLHSFPPRRSSDLGAEPVADIEVRPAQLKGIHVPEHLVPLAIDEFPVLFIAAACAEGETLVTGAEELRVKESDRIAVMAEGLSAMGVQCEVLKDGIRIQGRS